MKEARKESKKVKQGFQEIKDTINHCALYQGNRKDMGVLLNKVIEYCQILKTQMRV
ncbi:MAG: hypothetical protein ACTSPI_00850 [Candidatus Heimdallarchaeaceae archaeon]